MWNQCYARLRTYWLDACSSRRKQLLADANTRNGSQQLFETSTVTCAHLVVDPSSCQPCIISCTETMAKVRGLQSCVRPDQHVGCVRTMQSTSLPSLNGQGSS